MNPTEFDRERLSYDEREKAAERREALAKPWPARWGAYWVWLIRVMPEGMGFILFFASLVGLSALILGGYMAVVVLAQGGMGWALWFVAGAVVAGGMRKVLRVALATDRRYRE